jgi:chromate transporter
MTPGSPRALFFAFNRLALQGFGGVIAVAQRELVERLGWMGKAEFLEMLSIAQVLPGPNVVNLALIFGDRRFGWRGAVAALAGLMVVPTVIVLALTALYAQFTAFPMLAGALRGMAAVAAGLVAATGLKLAGALRESRLGPALAVALTALTVAGVAALRLPLAWVVLGLGGIATALAWWRLGP